MHRRGRDERSVFHRGRRRFLGFGAVAFAIPFGAGGQPAHRLRRIGIASFGEPPGARPDGDPIVAHLARLGWVEGTTVSYERRFARGSREAFPVLVGELLAAKVDVIYAAGSDIARVFQSQGSQVPVVFTVSDDPVATGLVASFAHPGGMFTGVSLMSPELAEKRLELLKATLPALRRVAVLYDPEHRASYVRDMQSGARTVGVELTALPFAVPTDFPEAFEAAAAARADAMFVEPSRFTLAYARRLAELAIAHRMAAMSPYDTFARAGGLMSYGPRTEDASVRAAAQIDRILKGARPSELPVEQPTRIALVLNLGTAAALGLAIPEAVRLRADEVIQ